MKVLMILTTVLCLSGAFDALALNNNDVIFAATGGQFKEEKGEFWDDNCGENTGYHNEVIDLNNDGQPEVFSSIEGYCWGGRAGVYLQLYVKNGKSGKWVSQFGFPAIYTILETRNQGYPDIEMGGPGFCFPVWRWNGVKYDLFKKCPH